MTSWANLSNLATAGGTLVLAVAAFSSIRSANRSAQAAERAVSASIRPVLLPSRLEDRPEKVIWIDGHHVMLEGGGAYIELIDGSLYLAVSLRNVNTGLAVLQGWDPSERVRLATEPNVPVEEFRRQTRDLYIPANDVGYWHAAIRSEDDPSFAALCEAAKNRQAFGVDLLYTDLEGGQRTISRFAIRPRADGRGWVSSTSRHWSLDRPNPR
ncbi:MAG TPA: hypothetical protein VL551_16355 [Actinospica sp.]|nr:hypothetical protein [Actinospica sp.]